MGLASQMYTGDNAGRECNLGVSVLGEVWVAHLKCSHFQGLFKLDLEAWPFSRRSGGRTCCCGWCCLASTRCGGVDLDRNLLEPCTTLTANMSKRSKLVAFITLRLSSAALLTSKSKG